MSEGSPNRKAGAAHRAVPAGSPARSDGAAVQGAQTLMRGLDVLEAVARGLTDLSTLSRELGITRTTTHRLAAALVDRRYLNFVPREGYSLGPKLLELGFRAQRNMPLRQAAHAHLEALAERSLDTVQLGILEADEVLYLDKVPGKRRFDILSTIGDRYPVWSTGLGKALALDMDEARWARFFDVGTAGTGRTSDERRQHWLAQMRAYAQAGVAYDLEESEPQLRCVAAPIRDGSGEIVAALSVSSFAQYMQPERMKELSADVLCTARAISEDLGWHAR